MNLFLGACPQPCFKDCYWRKGLIDCCMSSHKKKMVPNYLQKTLVFHKYWKTDKKISRLSCGSWHLRDWTMVGLDVYIWGLGATRMTTTDVKSSKIPACVHGTQFQGMSLDSSDSHLDLSNPASLSWWGWSIKASFPPLSSTFYPVLGVKRGHLLAKMPRCWCQTSPQMLLSKSKYVKQE